MILHHFLNIRAISWRGTLRRRLGGLPHTHRRAAKPRSGMGCLIVQVLAALDPLFDAGQWRRLRLVTRQLRESVPAFIRIESALRKDRPGEVDPRFNSEVRRDPYFTTSGAHELIWRSRPVSGQLAMDATANRVPRQPIGIIDIALVLERHQI